MHSTHPQEPGSRREHRFIAPGRSTTSIQPVLRREPILAYLCGPRVHGEPILAYLCGPRVHGEHSLAYLCGPRVHREHSRWADAVMPKVVFRGVARRRVLACTQVGERGEKWHC